jgi:hypothetical protein
LTTAVKEKILWRNAAGLYGVVPEDLAAATSPMESRELRAIRSALSQSASSA